MKIPTLLALAMLIAAGLIGFILFSLTHNFHSAIIPKNITLVNLSDKSASIIWQTDQPATGLLSWGNSDSLGNSQNDFRDSTNPVPHLNHLVNLSDLSSESSYFFRVRSDLQFYPDQTINFKTAKTPSDQTLSDAKQNQPLFGVVVDQSLKPVDEALVTLEVDGAADLATLTSDNGNFIIPLSNLRLADLSDLLILKDKRSALLVVQKQSAKSEIKLSLPLGAVPLPKIILGQNSDFSSLASSSAKPSNPLDLNGDGVVNSLDLSIFLQSFGTSRGDPKYNENADFDHDGKIDQHDLDILKAAIK